MDAPTSACAETDAHGPDAQANPLAARFLERGGETGALIAAREWSATPLGPIEGWPQSLKTALGLILHSPVAIVMLWGPEGVMLYNDAYSVFAGARHPGLLGSNVREGWPEVAEFNDNVMRVGLAGGTLSYKNQELTLYRSGQPEQVWLNLDYSPVFDEAGAPAGVVAVVVETTEQVKAEVELKAERDRARNVLEGMADGFLLLDHDFTILEINSVGLKLDGRPRETFIGRKHWEAWPQMADTPLSLAYRKAMAERQPLTAEHHYTAADGRSLWLEIRGYPVAEGLALFYRDITRRKDYEEHLRLMVNELNHRVKNSLATVQAVVGQTLRRNDVPSEVHDALTQRLQALARAHDVLTEEKWAGANLREIALRASEPYGSERFRIGGPPVVLKPKAAIALALAFHELATNAAKYGALSNATGRVEILWGLDPTPERPRLTLTWTESGGPPVSPPEAAGFGTRLIERALASDLDAAVELDFPATGVICRIESATPEN